MKIGQHEIGTGKVFLIAEIGNNHNGDTDRAFELIKRAKAAGADCVKFQMRNLETLYKKSSLKKNGEDLGSEYILDLLNKFELTTDEHFSIFNFCKELDIQYLCTPWDEESLRILEEFGVDGYKVASADLTNTPFIEQLAGTGKPLIISTGMSTFEEINLCVEVLKSHSSEFAILHCNSTYPAPFQDINLKFMEQLKKLHNLVGYSGHERGINIAICAAALDACIIEKHFTLDRNMEGPDHAASLETEELQKLVLALRETEMAMGSGAEKFVSQGELMNRENLSKSLVAARKIKSGEKIVRDDILIKSPGQGISPQKINFLIGTTMKRDIEEEGFFFSTDLDSTQIVPSNYSFKRRWGIPVRFHDVGGFSEICSPDLWEFHLSYSDLELDPKAYCKHDQSLDFIVHAPELFAESHLLDLCSLDEDYRKKSIENFNKVLETTTELRKIYPKTTKPLIVTNIGGFSMDEPFDDRTKSLALDKLELSLEQLNLSETELLPQTMAPFPWHFGGQRFQNLFVSANDIKNACERFDLRICLDVSHSHLTCRHLGKNFNEFIEEVAPFTAHLHIADARGVNGEGLQIGDGEIDFYSIHTCINNLCPHASFIPEIWQGHKNLGEGFWIALNKLEGIFS